MKDVTVHVEVGVRAARPNEEGYSPDSEQYVGEVLVRWRGEGQVLYRTHVCPSVESAEVSAFRGWCATLIAQPPPSPPMNIAWDTEDMDDR